MIHYAKNLNTSNIVTIDHFNFSVAMLYQYITQTQWCSLTHPSPTLPIVTYVLCYIPKQVKDGISLWHHLTDGARANEATTNSL